MSLGVDGATRQVHLTPAHATALRQDLDPWVAHARRTGCDVR